MCKRGQKKKKEKKGEICLKCEGVVGLPVSRWGLISSFLRAQIDLAFCFGRHHVSLGRTSTVAHSEKEAKKKFEKNSLLSSLVTSIFFG